MQNNGQHMCFADFEFTCGSPAHRLKSEMLSVGLVICSSDYTIKEKFYCTAKPNRFPKLTSQCKKLTHLTQAEINVSADSNEVLEAVTYLMKKYFVRKLFVWGNFDRPGLVSDIKQHIQFRMPHKNIDIVSAAIEDIQNGMVKEMQLPQAVCIEELASVFGYVPSNGTFHNALNDAEALYTIHKAVKTTDFLNSEQFIALRQERLDRIAAAKALQEQKRRELAFSIELSDEEKSYFEEISSQNNEKAVRKFIYTRSKFINSFNRNPDIEKFVMVVFDQPRRLKVIPITKYIDNRSFGSIRTETFSKDSFGYLVVSECKA